VLVERERDKPRLVDNVTVTESFDPQGEPGARSARLRFRLTRPSADSDIQVVDAAGDVVATLIEERDLGDFEFHDFRWHGERDAGGLAPSGSYRFRLGLEGLGREITIQEPIEVLSDGAGGA
jgi:hypothetical protein